MPDTNTILKYLKVKALAEQGSPGERDNAARILKKLVSENPGIQRLAEQYLREKKQEEEVERNPVRDPYPSGVWPGTGGTPRNSPATGNWEDIFNFARGVVNNAYDFANTMANAYAGRLLAEDYVESSTRSSRSGNVSITLKMPLAAYGKAQTLNLVQKQAFRQALHEMLAAELDIMLGEEEE